jgi:hypothetical protein
VSQRIRTAAIVIGVIGVALAVVLGRVLVESRQEATAARQALASGDVEGAITHLGRAARWYAPGNSASVQALDDLRDLALEAESNGDQHTALDAWQTIRGAILSTRSFFVPHASLLEEANQHIATLMAELEPPTVAPDEDDATRRAWHLALLERDDAPRVTWTLLALAGLAGWIAAALLFIYRAIGVDDRLKARPALYCGLGAVAGFAAFLIGLARA